MNYGLIKYGDDVNADGMSVSIFVSGCDFACKNCFNKQAQDKTYGKEFNGQIKNEIYKYFEENFKYIDNLCILGGDSMMDYNYQDILAFVKEFRSKFPTKMIYIWTGYTFDYLLKNRREILDYIDVVCDGQFIQELYRKGLKYVGSLNQEIIDVKESLKQNKKVLFYENKV
jgi:anaerobic ribonucleoside-triphosphate reductase activating protein